MEQKDHEKIDITTEQFGLQNLQTIQNPLRVKTKGRPPIKCYKSSVEIE